MNKKLIALSTAALLVLPLVSLAVFNPGNPPNTNPNLTVIGIIDLIIGFIWPVIVILIIILFTVAAFLFFSAQGDPEKVAQARLAFIWGVAGTVVIFLAWSVPFIVKNALGV